MDEPTLFEVPREMWHLRRCPVCGCRLAQSMTHTYVVQRMGWVKIGATSNVRRRLNELARPAWAQHLLHPPEMDWYEPLVVHQVLEGDTEHDLHERFAGAHVVGEWFLPNEEMKAWLIETTSSSPCSWSPTSRSMSR